MSPKAKAALVVIVAFFAGLLSGLVGDRAYLIITRQFFPRHGADFAMHRLLDRMDSELKLTPQQHVEVQRILELRHQHIEAISNGVRQQIRQQIDEGNAEIEKLLTPEQRTKFQEMRMRLAAKRHRLPRAGSPPPP